MGFCTAVEGVVLELMLGMRRLGLADSTRMGSLYTWFFKLSVEVAWAYP